ncbi:MAG: hypothetical protein IPK04_14190 [Bdellovibrionales bacterium]|nr:hypothetical protein [Bdellovibrionales bacterium]
MARIILKQLLIFPRVQIKYTAIYAGVTLVPILVLMASHFYFIHQLTRIDLSIEEMSFIRQNSIELNIFYLHCNCHSCGSDFNSSHSPVFRPLYSYKAWS